MKSRGASPGAERIAPLANRPPGVRISSIGCTRKPVPFRHNCLILRSALVALALIPVIGSSAEFTFEIPPVPVSVEIGGQHVVLTISGEVSGVPMRPGVSDQPFLLDLRADLGDFQAHLTPLLQTELNKADRCGERVSVGNTTLAPAAPAADLTVQLHFEKWICIKALGRDSAKKLLAGDATVHVILTPSMGSIENSAAAKTPSPTRQTVRLDAEIGAIDADGPLGDLLRSGSVGSAVRDKIREAMLKAFQKSTELEGVMPAEAQRYVTIQKAAFADRGSGRLELDLTGRLQIPGEQVSSVLEQFGNRK